MMTIQYGNMLDNLERPESSWQTGPCFVFDPPEEVDPVSSFFHFGTRISQNFTTPQLPEFLQT